MSVVKRMMEEQERLEGVATDLLLETGAIERCNVHHEVLLDQMDGDAQKHAYALAADKLKSDVLEGDRKALLNAIKAVITDTGAECYSCARAQEDD